MLERPEPTDDILPVGDVSAAQHRTNFALVMPAANSPWSVNDATVRGESARHYSTYRFFLKDTSGRRLRVKQYFNDWWIPTVADVSLRGPGRPILLREGVAFAGRDYRRNEGACGHRLGTAVEFSLERGDLSDAEWAGLWDSLVPAVTSAAADVRRSSYARRNYWNRWKRTEAPWNTTELSSLRWSDPTSETMQAAAWALTADRWAPVPGTIDSIGFRDDGPQGEEVQMVFRSPMTLNATAWLRVVRHASPAWRPLIDASEVNRPVWTRHRIADHEVERACMHPDIGNWFYAWRDGDAAYELHLRAERGLNAAAADLVLARLLA